MTPIVFSENAQGLYEATINGFEGILQIDRSEVSIITIYAKTEGGVEHKVYDAHTSSTLVNMSFDSCVALRIVCDIKPTLAQYEAVE